MDKKPETVKGHVMASRDILCDTVTKVACLKDLFGSVSEKDFFFTDQGMTGLVVFLYEILDDLESAENHLANV